MKPSLRSEALKNLKISDLAPEHLETIQNVLEQVGAEVNLSSKKDLSFISAIWKAEKRRGRKADQRNLKLVETMATFAANIQANTIRAARQVPAKVDPRMAEVAVQVRKAFELQQGKGMTGTIAKGEKGLDEKFGIVRLCEENVSEKPRALGKLEFDYLFDQLWKLLTANFPDSEIETKAQYRAYFYDPYRETFHADVAVTENGEVIGACLWSHPKGKNLIMPNIIVTKGKSRMNKVSAALLGNMMVQANDTAKIERGEKQIDYIIAEIEKPDGAEKDIEMRELRFMRAEFHDTFTHVKTVKCENGQPLEYWIPDMKAKTKKRKDPNAKLDEEKPAVHIHQSRRNRRSPCARNRRACLLVLQGLFGGGMRGRKGGGH
ncbi:Uncharacterised protein [Candidatus Gugararchaeum adminiculabundum]|nr:Uncharacterised protein [Candidatus Gugararchaeum adminiculabundum]